MKLRMERKTEKVTVTTKDGVGVFEVLPMTVDESAAMLKKYTPTRKWIGQTMVEKEPDYIAMRIEKVQKTIVAWDLEDENGKELPCTDENKKTAFLLHPELINKVLVESDKIGAGIEVAQEEEIKN